MEFAILGLLSDSSMHGYELRKRLNALLGAFRAFSYGSLYPTLRRMKERGWISEDAITAENVAPLLTPKRGKIVYKITAEGKERFNELLSQVDPASTGDEQFTVRMAFFARTSADVRLRILQGRRIRVEQRREGLRSHLVRTRERLDRYTLQLQEHGLEAIDREVRWLDELIASETSHPTGITTNRPQSTTEPGPTAGQKEE